MIYIIYFYRGSQHRQVGATDMNAKSSRSHAIFSVTMLQQKFIPYNSNNNVPPMSPNYSRPGTPSSKSIGSRAPSRANSVMSSSRFDDGEWVNVTSKFHFVDLAGSERVSLFLTGLNFSDKDSKNVCVALLTFISFSIYIAKTNGSD